MATEVRSITIHAQRGSLALVRPDECKRYAKNESNLKFEAGQQEKCLDLSALKVEKTGAAFVAYTCDEHPKFICCETTS